MSHASPELRARWAAFVEKISARYREILDEAAAGFSDLIASDPTDSITYGNALMAIHQRVLSLLSLLDQTYERDVAPRADNDKEIAREHASLREWIETSWETRRVELGAELYRAMWPLASAAMARPAACTKCGRPITKVIPYRVEALPCPACKTVNQVAPEAVVSTYFGGAPHAFGELAALPKRDAVRVYKKSRAQWREGDPHEATLEREALAAYCSASAAIMPMSAEDQRTWIETRMQALRLR